jgi:hypothetical protein
LLRWRRPEARLLLAMACIPQSTSLYETLPILLVARSFREALVFGLLSDAAFIGQRLVMDAPDTPTLQYRQGDVALWLLYVPALIAILRRPNEGQVPGWIDRLVPRPSARTSGSN